MEVNESTSQQVNESTSQQVNETTGQRAYEAISRNFEDSKIRKLDISKTRLALFYTFKAELLLNFTFLRRNFCKKSHFSGGTFGLMGIFSYICQ